MQAKPLLIKDLLKLDLTSLWDRNDLSLSFIHNFEAEGSANFTQTIVLGNGWISSKILTQIQGLGDIAWAKLVAHLLQCVDCIDFKFAKAGAQCIDNFMLDSRVAKILQVWVLSKAVACNQLKGWIQIGLNFIEPHYHLLGVRVFCHLKYEVLLLIVCRFVVPFEVDVSSWQTRVLQDNGWGVRVIEKWRGETFFKLSTCKINCNATLLIVSNFKFFMTIFKLKFVSDSWYI